jgi:hypothetical protein
VQLCLQQVWWRVCSGSNGLLGVGVSMCVGTSFVMSMSCGTTTCLSEGVPCMMSHGQKGGLLARPHRQGCVAGQEDQWV